MEIAMMTESERIEKASKLDLLSIAQNGLITKEMWAKHTGAQYNNVKALYVRCKICGDSLRKNIQNFEQCKKIKGGFRLECRPCTNKKKAQYRVRMKKKIENANKPQDTGFDLAAYREEHGY